MSAAVFRNQGYGLLNLIQRPFFGSLALSARIHPFSAVTGRKQISIGASSKVGAFCRLSAQQAGSSIKIGVRCQISPYAMLMAYGGFIEMGDDCSVNPFCVLYGHGGLKIGNGVRIASGSVIVPANHNFGDTEVPIHQQGVSTKGIVIEDDVWIAANVTILDGVRVGRGSIVAAGAVLSNDVEPYTIVGGVPARLIKRRK